MQQADVKRKDPLFPPYVPRALKEPDDINVSDLTSQPFPFSLSPRCSLTASEKARPLVFLSPPPPPHAHPLLFGGFLYAPAPPVPAKCRGGCQGWRKVNKLARFFRVNGNQQYPLVQAIFPIVRLLSLHCIFFLYKLFQIFFKIFSLLLNLYVSYGSPNR